MTDRLGELVRRDAAGKLTRTSKRDLRRAFATVDRQHRASRAHKDLAKASRTHMDRMRKVAARELGQAVALVTDSPAAGERARKLTVRAKVAGLAKRTLSRQAKLATDLRRKMVGTGRDDALRMLERGSAISTVAARLTEIGQQTTRRADLIGANETETVNGQLTRSFQKAAGIDRYVWRGQLDDREREEHLDREGEVFSWDNPPSDGHPGEPSGCRCVAEPIVPDALLDDDE